MIPKTMKFKNAFRKTIIVISSSLIYLIIYGTVRLNSQLFVAVRERFGANREQGSFPFTLLYSVRNLSGPFIGYLGNKFGLRCTTVFGCLLSAVSLAACFLVEDIISFTILWGIVFGIGFGLSTTLISNILYLFFTKTFNLVQGIYLSSGSLGCFVLPAVAEYLLSSYGTSGTFLIISCFVLNSVPLAMLLKCPEETPKIESQVKVKEIDELFEISKDITISGAENVSRSNSEKTNSKELFHSQNVKSGVVIDVSSLSNVKILSVNGTLDKSLVYTDNKKLNDVINGCNFDEDCTRKKVYQFGSTVGILSKHKKAERSQDVPSETSKYSTENDTEKKFVFKGSNLDSMEHLDFPVGKSHKYHVKKLTRDSYNFMSRNLQVFVDPAYILICISFGVIMIPVTVLTTVMVDAWRDIGVSEDVTILMTFATSDIVGRLVFGYLADLKCTSPLKIYALTCGLYGLLLIGFTWLKGFYAMVVFFAVVGLLMGGIVATPAGVIRDYIRKEDLTMAFSSRYFLFGLLNLSQPSVIGYFRETLQSYDGLFYVLGSMCIFGTLVSLCVPTAARYRDRKRNKRIENEQNCQN